MDPAECRSSSQAISRARSLAAKKAGAVAFSRTGDPNIGEFADAVVLFSVGEGRNSGRLMRHLVPIAHVDLWLLGGVRAGRAWIDFDKMANLPSA